MRSVGGSILARKEFEIKCRLPKNSLFLCKNTGTRKAAFKLSSSGTLGLTIWIALPSNRDLQILLKGLDANTNRVVRTINRRVRGILLTNQIMKAEFLDMTKSVDLAKELSEQNPIPFSSFLGAYIVKDGTPAHQFTTVLAPILKGEYCLALPSRDFFDETLATTILNFVAKQITSFLAMTKPLVLLKEFACSPYAFDSIAVLSPTCFRVMTSVRKSVS